MSMDEALKIANGYLQRGEGQALLPDDARTLIGAITIQSEALKEAEAVIRDWLGVTSSKFFEHPWNGKAREWLAKYGDKK